MLIMKAQYIFLLINKRKSVRLKKSHLDKSVWTGKGQRRRIKTYKHKTPQNYWSVYSLKIHGFLV